MRFMMPKGTSMRDMPRMLKSDRETNALSGVNTFSDDDSVYVRKHSSATCRGEQFGCNVPLKLHPFTVHKLHPFRSYKGGHLVSYLI